MTITLYNIANIASKQLIVFDRLDRYKNIW